MAAAAYFMLTQQEMARRCEEIKRIWAQIRKDGHTCGCVKYSGQYPQLFWCHTTPCIGPQNTGSQNINPNSDSCECSIL